MPESQICRALHKNGNRKIRLINGHDRNEFFFYCVFKEPDESKSGLQPWPLFWPNFGGTMRSLTDNQMSVNDRIVLEKIEELWESSEFVSTTPPTIPRQYSMLVNSRIFDLTKIRRKTGCETFLKRAWAYHEIMWSSKCYCILKSRQRLKQVGIVFTGLKFLVRICTDLAMPEAKEYKQKVSGSSVFFFENKCSLLRSRVVSSSNVQYLNN